MGVDGWAGFKLLPSMKGFRIATEENEVGIKKADFSSVTSVSYQRSLGVSSEDSFALLNSTSFELMLAYDLAFQDAF